MDDYRDTAPALPNHVDALQTGRRLGVYQLQERIGAGGMGEVYRARDTRLNRDVAIKVLPRALTADPDRLARFAREARVLAALNHPNIATIHGFEDGGDVHGLVMELVDGDTLAGLIRRGSLSPAECVAIAIQIADALGASHDKGIVHRDLKPSNIKVTSAGIVKLLDFGLARVAAEPSADVVDAPTITGTLDGLIIGTAPYMSPEQTRGQAVDRRTDIWAFGCVLFEMLSGRAAFSAATVPDIIAAVVGRDPDWDALPASTAPPLLRLIRRCLQKDSRRRLRDIADSRDDLEDATRTAAPDIVSPVREVDFRRITDFRGRKESPAVSPDGKMAAFVAVVGGRRQIWIRFLAGGSALQITRDDVDHEQPRWAPDSSRLIYYTSAPAGGRDGTIWEISALGGSPRRVTTATGGGDISRDGQRVAVLQGASGGVALVTMARDGSQARRILFLPDGFTYTSPRWAPDARLIAMMRASNVAWEQCLDLVSVDAGERRVLVRNDWLRGFTWRPDGNGIVYSSSRGSTVRYPPTFNLRTVDRDGSNDRQLTFGDHSYVDPDAYAGTALLTARVTSQSDVWRFPTDGTPADNVHNAVRVTNQTAQVQTPSPSPDDSEVVYLSDSGGHGNLWIARTDGSSSRQLTFESDPDVAVGAPRWSPRGDVIVFIMSKGGQTDLWLIDPDGGGLARIVDRAWGPCWSGDGQWIYYTSLVVGADRVEKVHRSVGDRTVVRRELGSRQPAIAPDGGALYYDTRVAESAFGHWGADHEIWCARPEDGPPVRIGSITAGRVPISSGMFHTVLSPDGRWLAIPLIAGATTNIWGIATDGSGMRPFTDFRDRSIVIARSVSWSCVGNSIYAAVAETEIDIVVLDGVMHP